MNYAAPGELVDPEAEAAVHQNEAPNAIRRFFRHIPQALTFYCLSKQRQFGPQSLGSTCTQCGTSDQLRIAVVLWQVNIRPKTFHFSSQSVFSQRFDTLHRMCDACLSSLRRSIMRVRWMHYVALGFLVAAAVLCTAWILASGANRALFASIVILTWLMIRLLEQLAKLLLRRTLPPAIKACTPRQVQFIVVHDFVLDDAETLMS